MTLVRAELLQQDTLFFLIWPLIPQKQQPGCHCLLKNQFKCIHVMTSNVTDGKKKKKSAHFPFH